MNVRESLCSLTIQAKPGDWIPGRKDELQIAEPGRSDPSAQEVRHGDRLAFTLDADTGEILKYEAVDAAGGRRGLSQNG